MYDQVPIHIDDIKLSFDSEIPTCIDIYKDKY